MKIKIWADIIILEVCAIATSRIGFSGVDHILAFCFLSIGGQFRCCRILIMVCPLAGLLLAVKFVTSIAPLLLLAMASSDFSFSLANNGCWGRPHAFLEVLFLAQENLIFLAFIERIIAS